MDYYRVFVHQCSYGAKPIHGITQKKMATTFILIIDVFGINTVANIIAKLFLPLHLPTDYNANPGFLSF